MYHILPKIYIFAERARRIPWRCWQGTDRPQTLNFEKRKKENQRGDKQREEEALSKARESHLVVAALIATVTFATAFTLPGGYKSDRGTAILVKKAVFIVFVISDTMSMVLSISAVFIHFLISLIHGLEWIKHKETKENTTDILFSLAMFFYHDWHGCNDYRICHGYIRGSRIFLGACHHHLSYWSELLLPCVYSV